MPSSVYELVRIGSICQDLSEDSDAFSDSKIFVRSKESPRGFEERDYSRQDNDAAVGVGFGWKWSASWGGDSFRCNERKSSEGQ